jgi:radical SAM protein (TIGR01212 family)
VSSTSPYYSRNLFFLRKFGQRVWKISVDAGASCPNRDGTVATGGCVFCDPASFSPSRRLGRGSIREQIAEGIGRLRNRRATRFVAYFQPGSNTHAPAARLREQWSEALDHPQIDGIVVGTRPDCLPDEIVRLLEEFAAKTWLSVELGLQTIHDRTLDWMNRGHRYESFLDAVGRSRGRGFEIGAHVILGLPGESHADMMATAAELARLEIDSVKLHNLYAVENTPLAAMVRRGEVRLPELAEYVGWVVDFLEVLPPSCVIDRTNGDAPPEYLVGPSWCLDKSAVRAAIEKEFRRRGSRQGCACCFSGRGP